MSSVQDYIKCPQCEGVCFTDFDCKSQEYYAYCQRCGYAYTHEIRRFPGGKAITRRNGFLFYKDKEKRGYGAMRLAEKDGIARVYGLSFWTALWAGKTLQRFLQTDFADPDGTYLYLWDWKTKSYKSIHGKTPPSYDEEFPENNE